MELELLTADDVAKALRVSPRQVWKLRASGRLPAPVHLARSVRWRAQEVRDWIEAGCPAADKWRPMREAGHA